MADVRQIAALCVAQKSIYKSLDGVDAYDIKRDCRTFPGGMPVVCHPTCKGWSVYTKQQAKLKDGEMEAGFFCAQKLRECGGVLEQPAHSELFKAAELPLPGEPEREGLWSMEVWQAWWGYPVKKQTWLCFGHVPKSEIEVPFTLHSRGGDRRRQQVMSKAQRSATTEPFAKWLIDAARRSTKC